MSFLLPNLLDCFNVGSTYFMLRLHKFGKEYGSLGIWNTQGMEKSHKLSRVAYNKSTQHGGGSTL